MVIIREIMNTQPIVVRPETSLHRALELLIEHNISGLPVVDEEGRIAGALSEKDLLQVFWETEARTVEAVMTREPITIAVDAPLVDVLDCLMASDSRRVLIHEDEKLVGLITRADLMPTVLQALLERT